MINFYIYSFLTDLLKQRCLERVNADRNRFIFFVNLFCIGITVVFLLLPIFAIGQKPWRQVENHAFKAGEKLTYLVYYGWFDVGYGIVEVKSDSIKKGEKYCYHLTGTGYTTSFWDWFFKVRDYYHSFVDMGSLLPLESYRKVLENDYTANDYVSWFHNNNKAIWTNFLNDSVKKNIMIPDNSQEILSAFYFARCINFSKYKPGDKIPIPNFVLEGVIYPFNLEYIGKEIIETDLGKFSCYVLRPLLQEGRIFKGQKDMTIWITDDGQNIPIRAKTEIVVGSIKMDLVEFKNLIKPITTNN